MRFPVSLRWSSFVSPTWWCQQTILLCWRVSQEQSLHMCMTKKGKLGTKLKMGHKIMDHILWLVTRVTHSHFLSLDLRLTSSLNHYCDTVMLLYLLFAFLFNSDFHCYCTQKYVLLMMFQAAHHSTMTMTMSLLLFQVVLSYLYVKF